MVNVGIIGCGSITEFRHAPEYAENVNSNIVGFFDINKNRASMLAAKYGGKIYDSYSEMLNDRKIDAVSVCTSNESHASISIEALKAGKHVLCEKPMATSIEDCENMLKVAQSEKKILAIGHNQRFAPAHIKAKQILDSGIVGDIITFKTTFGHRGPEYWSANKSKKTWFFNKKSASFGVMGDLGIHKIDLINWLTGKKVVEVQAYISTLDKRDDNGNFIRVDDNGFCLLKLENDVIGSITVSWTYYGNEDNSTILYCTNGIMKIYDNPDFPIEIILKNKEQIFYKTGRIQTNEDLTQDNSGIIDMFINSIVTNQPLKVTSEESLEAMRVVFACLESSKKGHSIRIRRESV